MTKLHQSTLLKTTMGKVLNLIGNKSDCPVCGAIEKRFVKYSFASFSLVKYGFGPTILVPNGMEIYVFRRSVSNDNS